MPVTLRFYRFERRQPSASPLSSHAEGQAFLLTEGAITFETPESRFILTARRLCWIPPGLPHGFTARGAVAGISVKLTDVDDLPATPRVLDPDAFLAAAFTRAMDHQGDRDDLWRVLARAIAEAPGDRLALPAPRDPRLRRMAAALMRSPADDRSVEAWAHTIGLSPRSLIRKLTAETGLGFARWRRRLRLIQALDRMQAAESATAAALASGFGSSASFSAAFRQETGTTSTAYLAPAVDAVQLVRGARSTAPTRAAKRGS